MANIIKKDEQIFFKVNSALNKTLKTTNSYWQKIISIKHPSINGKEREVQKVLQYPEIVKVSKSDKKVFLYYRKYLKYYLCVVARHENGNGFIITVYITNKLKEGVVIWKK